MDKHWNLKNISFATSGNSRLVICMVFSTKINVSVQNYILPKEAFYILTILFNFAFSFNFLSSPSLPSIDLLPSQCFLFLYFLIYESPPFLRHGNAWGVHLSLLCYFMEESNDLTPTTHSAAKSPLYLIVYWTRRTPNHPKLTSPLSNTGEWKEPPLSLSPSYRGVWAPSVAAEVQTTRSVGLCLDTLRPLLEEQEVQWAVE